ncbi:MAG TPA: hypothetical protein VIW64_16400 [Pyrinomonadaceae bacterium]|jgi:hypothetical protein
MKRRSRFLSLILIVGCLIGAWLFWVYPRPVDMAAYAPADSLLYLEANHPMEIFDAVSNTDAWRAIGNLTGTPTSESHGRWFRSFVRWTGLGPIRTVILTRAQVAVVVSELRAAEEGDSLNVKPEGALLIETHTSERRIRPIVEETLKTLAERTYGRPTERRRVIDGVEFVEWVAPDSSRQLVSAIFGSLVIVGTSEHVVQQCLAVAQRRAASLTGDAELQAMRARLPSERALTFGYVPRANSARLLAVSLPILLGRAPGDSQFQRLITNGATKIFGSVGWSSGTYLSGIEDRYLINLAPSIVEKLKPTFVSTGADSQTGLPNVYSITKYDFANPLATWQTLKTAVSSQVDALSTVLFSSLLKSALLSYGIDEPEAFLAAADRDLQTIRLDGISDRSILVARVRDRSSLRQLFLKTMRPANNGAQTAKTEMFEDAEHEVGAGLTDDLVVAGNPVDVRRYFEVAAELNKHSAHGNKMAFFASRPTNASVVTYSNDSDRLRRFAATLIEARAASVSSETLEAVLARQPYSVTETRLGERGIERTNRSPLGQFSSIVPLLFPEKSDASRR